MKRFFIGTVVLAGVLLVGLLIFYLIKLADIKSEVKPKLVRESTVAEISIKNHPQLFYADLEYNPQTHLVTQVNTGEANGDPPTLLTEQPTIPTDRFLYKIEIISDKNELLLSGWDTQYKTLITTDTGSYKFRVVLEFYPQAIVRLYLPNGQLIWTGSMQ